jgi:hypothetical protein
VLPDVRSDALPKQLSASRLGFDHTTVVIGANLFCEQMESRNQVVEAAK